MRLVLMVSKLIMELRLCLLELGFLTRNTWILGPTSLRNIVVEGVILHEAIEALGFPLTLNVGNKGNGGGRKPQCSYFW